MKDVPLNQDVHENVIKELKVLKQTTVWYPKNIQKLTRAMNLELEY